MEAIVVNPKGFEPSLPAEENKTAALEPRDIIATYLATGMEVIDFE